MPTELKYLLVMAGVAALGALNAGIAGLQVPPQYAPLIPVVQAGLVALTMFLRRLGKPE